MQILLVLSLSYILQQVSSKQLTTTISLSPSDPWKYLTKFSMMPGRGSFKLRAQLVSSRPLDSNQIQLVSNIFMDKSWPQVLLETNCTDKYRGASTHYTLDMPNDGTWSKEISGFLKQKFNPRFWYFTFSSCGIKEKVKIRVEVLLKNSNESEFSAEDMGLEYAHIFILLIYFFFLSKNTFRIVVSYEKNDDVPLSLIILNGSIFTQFGGILFKIVHLWVFWYNGKGVLFIDIVSQALEVISTILVSVLFILIASGWTLKYKGFPEADIYIPISMLIIAINLIIIAIGKISDDAYDKFSDYEGFPGFFIILLRILSWVWFLFLEKELEKFAAVRLRNFLFNFMICVTIYFLSLPFIVVVSWVFEPYSRKLVIFVLNNLVQVVIFIYTQYLLSDKSEFYQISILSKSVLPMGFK